MERFTDSVKSALDAENWYAALCLALVLPDICGKLEHPTERSGSRYPAWFTKWVEPAYTSCIGRPGTFRHVFLSGGDCYALRCSLLHQGEADTSQQRARETLERFHFIAPLKGNDIHCNQQGTQLMLAVDQFSIDICNGVEGWSKSVATDETIQERIARLISIDIPKLDGPLFTKL